MLNPNTFEYVIQGQKFYADPVRIRRLLLDNTMGKCWGITKEVNKTHREIGENRGVLDQLEQDLATNPQTEEEVKKLGELQQLTAEGKMPTLPFNELPREYKKVQYEGRIAALSLRLSMLEGLLANAAFAAFDLKPLDPSTGEGCTEQEGLDLLKLFLEYAEGKGERLGS